MRSTETVKFTAKSKVLGVFKIQTGILKESDNIGTNTKYKCGGIKRVQRGKGEIVKWLKRPSLINSFGKHAIIHISWSISLVLAAQSSHDGGFGFKRDLEL